MSSNRTNKNRVEARDPVMDSVRLVALRYSQLHDQLIALAAKIRRGDGSAVDLGAMERLLDQTRPSTEEERYVATLINFLSSYSRGHLVEYLFKVRLAGLLHMVDCRASVTALNVSELLNIWIDDKGLYVVERRGPDSKNETRRGREESSNRTRSPPNRTRLDGDRGRGEGRGESRGRRRREPRNGGKPVMDMEQCQKLIAKIEADQDVGALYPGLSATKQPAATPSAEPSKMSSKSADSSYLQAVVTGRATPPQKSVTIVKREPAEKAEDKTTTVSDSRPAVSEPLPVEITSLSDSGKPMSSSGESVSPPRKQAAPVGKAKMAQGTSPSLTKLLSANWADIPSDDDL
jgi:hypothetical protein